MKKIKQIYHPYWLWEDYLNGMWRKETKEYDILNLPHAIEFTGNHILYGNAMIRVINEWQVSCEHNLTDFSQNRNAWIGHAACCIEKGYPEYLVRQAWHYLTEEQQKLANNQADIAIKKWLTIKQKLHAQIEIRF
jgi:hypothetical protein